MVFTSVQTDIFGWIGTFGLMSTFLPDIILKLYHKKKPDFSLPFMVIRCITTISFLLFGIGLPKIQVIVANSVVSICLIILIIMKFTIDEEAGYAAKQKRNRTWNYELSKSWHHEV